MNEPLTWLLALGQQVWQQQRDEGASVCFVGIAPFVLSAAAVGLRSALSWYNLARRGRRQVGRSSALRG